MGISTFEIWNTGIRLCESGRDVEVLCNTLASETLVGVDTETTGCNPKKESPIGRARVWSLQLAGNGWAAFVPAQLLHTPALVQWLEGPAPKCGSNILNYDLHALHNEGIRLAGVKYDTWLMSKLLEPSELFKHDLKSWGKRMGYHTRAYEDIASVRKAGKEVTRKRDGVSYTNVLKGHRIESLDVLWELYPQRRQQIVEYACLDAVMSRDVALYLCRQLGGSV